MTLSIGNVHKLNVLKKITEGFILTDHNEEVRLPDEEVSGEIELGEDISVFIYPDKQGKLLATMKLPEVRVDTYGWAEVAEVLPHLGVFVNIGIQKEILVSKDELPLLKSVWPKPGDFLFVSLETDKKGRLLAEPISENEVTDDLTPAPASVLNNEIVGRVYRSTKAGSFILSEEGYRGFIHPYERKIEPRLGETIQGRVIDVKEDGTINVTLLPLKQDMMKEDAEVILDYLEETGGAMFLHDKSDPDDIRHTLNMSKAAFKRAIGKLLKEDKIEKNGEKTTLK